jgi:rhodanese-related sulfurtransferase
VSTLVCGQRLAGVLFAALLTASAHAAWFTSALDWPTLKRETRERHPAVKHITTRELFDWLNDKRRAPPLLLDARASDEFAVSHLRDAKHAPSVDAALRVLAQAPKDSPIVVYCSVGVRSAALAEKLVQRGYRGAANLEGSIFEWANHGYPLYRGDEVTSKVHPYDRKWGKLLDRNRWSDGGA